MIRAIIVSARDNVATALEAAEPGATIAIGDRHIVVLDRIPVGHKVAVRAIASGAEVMKYGNPIGTASADIPAGAHVHTHNLVSTRGRGDLAGGGASSSLHRIAEPPDIRS